MRGDLMSKKFLFVFASALLCAVLVCTTGCSRPIPQETLDQIVASSPQMATLTSQVASMQAELDAQSERADALQAEIANQDNQLYQLNLVANPKQLLVNYDSAMKDYEDRLTGKDAQGYAYGNLGDNVIPMLYDMVEGRDLPRGAIEKRITRLEKYVANAENIGDNEGEDTETLDAIKDLRKKLKSF